MRKIVSSPAAAGEQQKGGNKTCLQRSRACSMTSATGWSPS